MKNLTYPMLWLLAFMAMACSDNKPAESSNSSQDTKQIDNSLKVYVLKVGDILVKDISIFSPGATPGQTKQLTNTAFLIRHPKGDLMWDTGLPDEMSFMEGGNDTPFFTMEMPIMLRTQLDSIGVSADEIEFLALSHYHGDNIGNANLFTSSTLLLQQEEYDSLFNRRVTTPQTDSLMSNRFVKLTGDYDVFGDSTVVIKRAPGHTLGHQVLYLDLPEAGPVVISGDLYHFDENRQQNIVPSFNINQEMTLKSREKIEAFIEKRNATLWIQHDAEQMATIPHAPEYVK